MNFSRQSPSKRYQELVEIYRKMHKEGDKNPSSAVKKNAEDTFKGDQTKYYVKDIKKYIKFTTSKTILDYGSGKAVFYKKKDLKIKSESDKKEYKNIKDFWNVNEIKFYDVGVKEYQVFPNKNFDGIICTDVLEHIPIEDIPWVVNELFSFAKKFVYIKVACSFAGSVLPSGENAHITVAGPDWWYGLIYGISNTFTNKEFSLICSKRITETKEEFFRFSSKNVGKAEKINLIYD